MGQGKRRVFIFFWGLVTLLVGGFGGYGRGEPVQAAPVILKAPHLEYAPAAGIVRAEGGVLLQEGKLVVEAESLLYREGGEGEAQGVRLSWDRIIVSGAELTFTPGHYHLRQGRVTRCNLPHPEYYLASQEVLVIPNQQLVLRGNRFYLWGLPGLPLPPLVYPLGGGEEVRRLPEPQVGYNSRDGFYLGLIYPYPLRVDLTSKSNILWRSRQGFSLDQELRWRVKTGDLTGTFHYAEPGLLSGGIKYAWTTAAGRWEMAAERRYGYWPSGGWQFLTALPELTGSFPSGNLAGELRLGRLTEERRGVTAVRLAVGIRGETPALTLPGGLRLKNGVEASGAIYSDQGQGFGRARLRLTPALTKEFSLGSWTQAGIQVGYTLTRTRGNSPFAFESEDDYQGWLVGGTFTVKNGWKLEGGAVYDPTVGGWGRENFRLRREGHCFFGELSWSKPEGILRFRIGMYP